MRLSKPMKAMYVVCALAMATVIFVAAFGVWVFVQWLETTAVGKAAISLVMGVCWTWIAVMVYRSWVEDIENHDA